MNLDRRAFLSGSFLATGDRRDEPTRPGVAVVDRDACFPWQGTICISCRLVCPEGAIGMDGRGRPHVAADICNGCEKCIEICPVDAISASTGPADS